MDLTWDATAPHNPATYKVYITKANANYKDRALRWDDLEEIASGDMPQPITSSNPKQYKIPVTIPEGRSGKAMLYSVWQRNDAGNEGFFNCSDILIQGGENEPATPENENWIEEQPFIKPGFIAPEPGESVRFRLLGGSGSRGLEVVDINIPITAQNSSNYHWAEELAKELNENHSRHVSVGIMKNGHIQFDPSERHIFENRVWVKGTQYSSAMSIIPAEDPRNIGQPDIDNKPDEDTDNHGKLTWPAGIGTYVMGKTEVIGSDGKTWRCRPYPHGGWCNINHPAYEPGGARMAKETDSQAWERVN
jgi:chitin-binding protein